MRKNLFLTLALLVASFATVNAQWSQTLSAVDGLPGSVDALTNCQVVRTPMVSLDAPTDGVRITICNTLNTNNEFNKGTTMAAFAEIKVYDGEGNEVKFTPTSNSIQTGGADGGGMAALNDNDYTTYYHSFWGSGTNDREEGEYVYVELAFTESVSDFRVVLSGRPGSHKFSPTLLVLTPKGITGTPDEVEEPEQGTFELGEQLTTIDDLFTTDFVAIKGNTPESFSGAKPEEYNNFEGWGPRFLADARTYTPLGEELGTANAVQIISLGDGTFNLYWPQAGTYLAAGTFTDGQDKNAWAKATADKTLAAKLTITERGDGTFEMSYPSKKMDGVTPVEAWFACDPRVGTATKIFPLEVKAAIEADDYTQGFGLPASFAFSFYAAEYEQPAYLYTCNLRNAAYKASEMLGKYGQQPTEEDSFGAQFEIVGGAVAQALDMLATGEFTAQSAKATTDEINENLGWYFLTMAYQGAIDIMAYRDSIGDVTETDEEGNPIYGPNSDIVETVEPGKFLLSDWNEIMQPTLDSYLTILNEVWDAIDLGENIAAAAYTGDIIALYEGTAAKKAEFENKRIAITAYPIILTAAEVNNGVAAGITWNGNVASTSLIQPSLEENFKSFRITFLQNGPVGAGEKIDGEHPTIALQEMMLYRADGTEFQLTADKLQGNAIHGSDGSGLAGLVDKTYNEDGTIAGYGDHYHTVWGGHPTKEFVYLDVQLPEDFNSTGITLKFVTRGNGRLYATQIYVGPYGEAYDPLLESANEYNVKAGSPIQRLTDINDYGLFAIKGLLNTNPNEQAVAEPADEMWYAGEQPFHKSVLRENGVYMFRANADGASYNICNLATGKYWTLGGLTANRADAADIKFDNSTNPDFAGQNTFVLYTDIEPTTVEINYKWSDNDSINGLSVEQKYNVIMDWGAGSGIASRPVIDYQPGVNAENYPGFEDKINALTPANLAGSGFGDYLHFNKTNGEGEWKLFKVTMDNPYYFWMMSLATTFQEELGFGPNPGQYPMPDAVATQFAKVQAAIEAKDYANAENIATAFALVVEEALSGEAAERNPIIANATYHIESALFATKKHLFFPEGTTELRWDNAGGANSEFMLEEISRAKKAELQADGFLTSEMKDYYYIKSVSSGWYVGKGAGTSEVVPVVEDVEEAGVYVFENKASDIYSISLIDPATDQSRQLHANGHGEGKGNNGTVVYWDINSNSVDASKWRLITVSVPTSIEDIVAEGDNAATVKYYTVGGIETAAPVKGINIVEITYSNGVVETKKIVVE